MNKMTDIKPFANEPFTDFSQPAHRDAMKASLERIKQQLGRKIPLHIGSDTIFTDDVITSINPGQTDQTIGLVSKANQQLAEQAMQTALETFEQWKKVPASERADYLFKAAALMRQRKHDFSAMMIMESGKNYAEADADTAEAIDFMEFYAREMLRLDSINETQPLTPVAGEQNRLTYIPLGVGIVIPPWNFPLAICVGMTTAAIVSGNTVLLKPASTTPVIAHMFVELMEEIGLPPGVINYVPGSGAEVGDYLTTHPKTRFVSFTGSKEVGLRISKLSADTADGQIWIKRLVAEMGGKDGIVVDETADLDAAAQAIVASAFGFQGQKCSAGSRAVIVQSVYDEVVRKVTELTGKLSIGLPEDNYPVGPVIDQASCDKIMSYIEIGKSEGRLLTGGQRAEGNGYYIQPTVIADVKRDARIMQEEIFGPVLALCPAADYREAIDIYNDTEFGLTGSFFSKDEARIAEALDVMHCGNLYINRKCTGALVGAHPFGGFNMSGTDSKAGGHDYLLLFTQAKLTSRKLG
ncbi:L-glutamate gamma-semialdehyde dehydrogenase [Paenibacillus hunanensis]|uniref:L-glutamate gamma-semialdehyde dehydrogenase n=1 Tax=Paenibacillus hunanensis TaxID=539262 RepID=A0ABU1J0P3_9BACL|nr:L-glutamate gamma-semialdehyde dehydrogenase [Paenibacillus hunanensis]MDR6245081.1 1-pyrroline-5-carboxylate dehydrogenase [Paenibacillus hunanensis]GGI96622.1 1-pyrroline-5-carboxylate dehydrogenase [Paenibacillus hunanensis]